ncbi:hypothetical protein ACLOJK_040355 [Asimina triloba]
METSIIVAEAPGFLQVFSDGSVERFPLPISDESPDFSHGGFKSRDVVVDPSKPMTARLFFPDDTLDSSALLPPFCIGSTTWAGYHQFLGGLCKKTHCVAVSIDYRLPAPYEDGLDSIRWLSRNADSEPWLRRADLSRVFLSGDASGGNIVHHVMAEMKRRGAAAPRNVEIRRLLAMDPYFGSERRTESEAAEGAVAVVKLSNMLWGLSLPARPTEEASLSEAVEWSDFPPVVVFATGLDVLKERSVMHVEFLNGKGVKEAELVVFEGELHGYYLFHPQSESTRLLQQKMAEQYRPPKHNFVEAPASWQRKSKRTIPGRTADSGFWDTSGNQSVYAFLRAWADVCNGTTESAKMIIPGGKTFLVKPPIQMEGRCNSSSITVQVDGNIMAPDYPDAWEGLDPDLWLTLRQANNVNIIGTGVLDGRGSKWWAQACESNPNPR